jgi:hypothetical protein
VAADAATTEAAIDMFNNVLNEIDGAVAVLAPLLASVADLLQQVDDRLLLLHDQLVTISGGLLQADVDLPSTDAVVSQIVADIVASPNGQVVVGGMDQVSSGVSQAKTLISAYVSDVIAQVETAGTDAAATIDNVKAEVGGITVAAQRSPLPYGGDPATAPEGTQLAGAYEFRVDAADSNAPNTPWRILFGLVFLLGAGGLMVWMGKRRGGTDASPPTHPPEDEQPGAPTGELAPVGAASPAEDLQAQADVTRPGSDASAGVAERPGRPDADRADEVDDSGGDGRG